MLCSKSHRETVYCTRELSFALIINFTSTCSGRYDLKTTVKISLIDIQLLTAMGPPGGGRNAVTSRFLRHFNIISINAFSDDTMVSIFSSIMLFCLKINEFPTQYFTVGNEIVSATMEVSCHQRFNATKLRLNCIVSLKVLESFFFLQGVQAGDDEPASDARQVSLHL